MFSHYGAKLGPELMRLAIEGGGFCQPVEEDEYEDEDLGVDSGRRVSGLGGNEVRSGRDSGSGGANSDND